MREKCGVGGGYSRESPAASGSVSSRSGSNRNAGERPIKPEVRFERTIKP